MKRLALMFFKLCSTALAASPINTPGQVSAALDKQGAQAFFAMLDEQAADQLPDKIGSGQAAWVALAPKLATGADGANAEGLGIALAYALPKNATAVLKAADPVEGGGHILRYRVSAACPFIDDIPRSYKPKALRAVAAVKDPALQRVKTRCLAMLRKS